MEAIVRDHLNTHAPRALALLEPIKVTLTNFPHKDVVPVRKGALGYSKNMILKQSGDFVSFLLSGTLFWLFTEHRLHTVQFMHTDTYK